MKISARLIAARLLFPCLMAFAPLVFAGDNIPKAAWKRGIGQPLENAGGRKPALVHLWSNAAGRERRGDARRARSSAGVGENRKVRSDWRSNMTTFTWARIN